MNDPTARGFLEDIVAHPDDDTPRLIFADWLDEHGNADRAEFIRLQVERASLPEWEARQVHLRLRELELLDTHGARWKQELPEIEGVVWGKFRRGFVAKATFASFTVLEASAGDCWSAAPIEAVTVRSPRNKEHVELMPPIAGLRELRISSRVDTRSAERLAASPVLSTLRTLNIADRSLGTKGFRRLVSSPHLGNLKSLQTPFNSIGNGGIDALLDARSLTSLTALDLSEKGSYGRYGEDPIIEPDGVELLASWSGLARLRSLNLSGNAVGQAGLRALLGSSHATGLKELILRSSGLDSQAMQEFGAARLGIQLDVLDLGENLLESEGAAELATAPCLSELKVLWINRCEIPVDGARSLAEAPFLDSLRVLNAGDNRFGPEGLGALLERNPPCLHTLRLENADLGDEGVSFLAMSPASDTLLELDCAQNHLRDPAARALMESPHLRNLLILVLKYNLFSKEAASTLANSPLGERLAILEPPLDLAEPPPEEGVGSEIPF